MYVLPFWIGRHTCHKRVYLLWLALICTVFQHLIYFCWYVHMSFRLFRVPVNFLILSVRFWNFFRWNDPPMHISEVHIWFLTVTFITLIIRVPWIRGWFLMALSLSILLKEFLSWVWTSTVTSPWLRKIIYMYFLLICPNSNK